MVPFEQPRNARIHPAAYNQYAQALMRMGLPSREFRAIEADDKKVIVHPEDHTSPEPEPFMLRLDIVEFLDS